MDLTLPNIFMILLGLGLCFLMSNTIPATLMTISAVSLVLAIYVHWSKFGNDEYYRSTWQNKTKPYARLIIISCSLFAAYVLYAMNTGYPVPGGLPKIQILVK